MNVFKLEEYLAKHEFSAKHLLCCSDAESLRLSSLLALATPEEQEWWNTLHLGYTEVRGLPRLRELIAKALYPDLNADNILMFAGAEDGIYCTLSTLMQSGDHAIVLTPCYQSLFEIPRERGATVTAISLREENQWRIDLDAIKQAIQPNTTCIIINFPHNPTGQVIEENELSALTDLASKHGIWIFSDEVYRLLGNPEKPWASPAACLSDKSISLGVMSKAFGLAGLRIGWIAARDTSLLKKIEYTKHYTSICNSGPSEILALIALRNKEVILDRNNEIVASNLKLLDDFFSEFNDSFNWVRPQGGCVGFVKSLHSEPVGTFCDRLIKQESLLLMPSSIYDYPSNHFRIGFGRQNMPECLEKLRRFMQHECR